MFGTLKRFYSNPLLLGSHLIAAAIALFAPAEVMHMAPNIAAACEAVASLVPTVANYAARSSYPGVTKLYFSLLLPLSPLVFFATLNAEGAAERARMKEKFAAAPRRWTAVFITFSIFMAPAAIFLLVANPGYDFHLAPINSSRWALALFGPLFAGGISFALLAFVYRGLGVLLNKEW